MQILDARQAFSVEWNGTLNIRLPPPATSAESAVVTAALKRFALALERGVFHPAQGGELSCIHEGEHTSWQLTAHRLPGAMWVILGNVLAFSLPDTWRKKSLAVSGADAAFQLELTPRIFEDSPPAPAEYELDLASAGGYLREFVLRVEFAHALAPEDRESVCQGLEGWTGLVDDNGGFPMEESPDLGSIMGGPVCRFEDPATAIIEGEGIAASPSAFHLLLRLCSFWNQKFPVVRLSLDAAN